MKRALTLVLAFVMFATISILWIVSDRRAAQRVYDHYSSANTSEGGLSLAAGYLAKKRKVAMLTRPLGREPIEQNAVVFRITEELPRFFDPEQLDDKQIGPPKPKQPPLLNEKEEAFVRNGGRIVIAARQGLLDATPTHAKTARKVLPIWPAVKELKLPDDPRAFVSLRPRMLPVFLGDAQIVLARERIGRGELFVLSTPELLRNDNLVRNLALLAALAGDGRAVYFDELIHGITRGDGALALMQEWNLGPFLMMLGAAAILVFWRGSRRVGPAEDDARETRSDAIDLVRSLGALYHEATSDTEAIALYYDALTRAVAHNSGLRGDALRKRVEELTGGRLGQGSFAQQLEIINSGFERVSKSQSLRVSEGSPRAVHAKPL
ncbi:MAG TPA: hypothetical protein VGQ76_19225 [Thermoanaerobaculia bacterium]|jgi:hypothetical protein|nr:hypothetical protein [Thermoanaerobaculia bacterium]